MSQRVKILQDEIELLSKLKHINIVRYLGFSKTIQNLNIILEYVPGGSIASLLKKFGSFSENVIRKYTQQILEGLKYLHINNVIHRDIKGANILVDKNGICKLTDFGSAKKISAITFNSVHGTTNWMAPEVICQKNYGRFADIWSLGCTVIEMITGNPPWSEYSNPIAAMMLIAKGKKIPIPSGVSGFLSDFIKCCLKKNPCERVNAFKLINHPFLEMAKPNILSFIPEIRVSKNPCSNSKKIFPDVEEREDEQMPRKSERNPFIDDSENSDDSPKRPPLIKNCYWVPSIQNIDLIDFPGQSDGLINFPSTGLNITASNSGTIPEKPKPKAKNDPNSKKKKVITSEERLEIKIEMKKIHKTVVESFSSEDENGNPTI